MGGENATLEQRGMSECHHNLNGWRCVKCGFSGIDQNAINYYVAQSILPKILFDACKNNNLISVIDDVFEYSLPGIQEMDFSIKKLIKKGSINFIQEIDNWMRPCPSCSSNNTAVYRCTIKSNKFLPADINLPLNKKMVEVVIIKACNIFCYINKPFCIAMIFNILFLLIFVMFNDWCHR